MIFPPYLRRGDAVALVALARKVSEYDMKPFRDLCNDHGLICLEAPGLYEEYHQFAGEDSGRANQFNWAISNEKVKAIWCVRGGYGITRLLSDIHWDILKGTPKWFLGFSDATLILNKLCNQGIASIHCPMPIQANGRVSLEDWHTTFRTLLGTKMNLTLHSDSDNKVGISKGRLIGGNLSLLAHSIGTPWMPKPKQAILFMEEVDEYLYHIDRMLWQLKHSGFMKTLSGVIVGQFSEIKDNPIAFGKDAYQIIMEHLKDFEFPVVFNFPAGHGVRNFPLVIGSKVQMKVSPKEAVFEYL